MNTATVSGTPMELLPALGTAVMGYAIVFLGIVMLMCVIIITGKIMTARQAKSVPAKAPDAPVPEKIEAPKAAPAPGSAGEVKLFDVPDKEAAMIMAIVANKMDRPLNELRFKSIKEISEEE